jgi:hypothetical protein
MTEKQEKKWKRFVRWRVLFVLMVFVFVFVFSLWVFRLSSLARPRGVPFQARNLGNIVQLSYWHWCQEIDGYRACETYTRSGGFPVYSGLYLPITPKFSLKLSEFGSTDTDELTDIFRRKVLFDQGYNWPLIERIKPVGVREQWSYRFIFKDCLKAASTSDLDQLRKRMAAWLKTSEKEWEETLRQHFARIEISIEFVNNRSIILVDRVAGVNGTADLPLKNQCFGQIYLHPASN